MSEIERLKILVKKCAARAADFWSLGDYKKSELWLRAGKNFGQQLLIEKMGGKK